LNKFGEEGNLVIIGVKDNAIFTQKPSSWSKLMNSIKGDRAVDLVVSLNDLKKLQKNDSLETFELVPFVDQSKTLTKLSPKIRKELLMTCLFTKDCF
jgi:hypothetical protein